MEYQKIARDAVYNGEIETKSSRRIWDYLFSNMFNNVMIYPQIWEDPEVDLEALEIQGSDDIVAIASGGCNLLNMLTENPNSITGVDLCRAHLALNSLKQTAFSKMDFYEDFFEFFGKADSEKNLALYKENLKPFLSKEDQRYWDSRVFFRKRITAFSRNFYRYGALGNFIGFAHFASKLFGVDPSGILKSSNLSEQKAFYEANLKTILFHPLVRFFLKSPLALFGLGIPASQFQKLRGDREMFEVISNRLERLACNYSIKDNYFAWQAFGRKYDTQYKVAIPRYLKKEYFELLKQQIQKISMHQITMTQFLKNKSEKSLDGYVLLDAQDWMDTSQLNELWYEIDRTSKLGARVIFRTAAEDNLVKTAISPGVLANWKYCKEKSQRLYEKDRSAIYGGFHLMKKISNE